MFVDVFLHKLFIHLAISLSWDGMFEHFFFYVLFIDHHLPAFQCWLLAAVINTGYYCTIVLYYSVINTGGIITMLQTGSPSHFAQAQHYQNETHFRASCTPSKKHPILTRILLDLVLCEVWRVTSLLSHVIHFSLALLSTMLVCPPANQSR